MRSVSHFFEQKILERHPCTSTGFFAFQGIIQDVINKNVGAILRGGNTAAS